MKIAFLTSGILPIPAVQGGAVENFLDFFLEYNNKYKIHDITVFSIYDPLVKKHPALQSDVNHYHYIDTHSIIAKIKKYIFSQINKDSYHHYSIEYYLHEAYKQLKKDCYDVIVLNNRPGYAVFLAGKTNAKLVYSLYNDKLNNTTRFHQIIYDAASLIISTSNFISNRVRTINDYANKCITVYSGIELSNFSNSVSPSSSLVTLGIVPEDFVLFFSGRITKEKGILELIEAVNQIKITNLKLLVIGSSFYGNSNNENDFIKMLKEKAEPIKEHIIFTGFIPYNIIPSYLCRADVAVIPSVWDDPFPTTVLEAQAMGLPIITTRRGGIPEEVSEENAILLNTDEQFVDNLAGAIQYLYEHPEKRVVMAKASLERSKLFDKEKYAKNFFKALEDGI